MCPCFLKSICAEYSFVCQRFLRYVQLPMLPPIFGCGGLPWAEWASTSPCSVQPVRCATWAPVPGYVLATRNQLMRRAAPVCYDWDGAWSGWAGKRWAGAQSASRQRGFRRAKRQFIRCAAVPMSRQCKILKRLPKCKVMLLAGQVKGLSVALPRSTVTPAQPPNWEPTCAHLGTEFCALLVPRSSGDAQRAPPCPKARRTGVSCLP